MAPKPRRHHVLLVSSRRLLPVLSIIHQHVPSPPPPLPHRQRSSSDSMALRLSSSTFFPGVPVRLAAIHFCCVRNWITIGVSFRQSSTCTITTTTTTATPSAFQLFSFSALTAWLCVALSRFYSWRTSPAGCKYSSLLRSAIRSPPVYFR